MPRSFSECPGEERAAVNRLYFDVDDTLTWQGQLPETAVSAVYAAADAGISLVAVTGRSASWGELLLRLLPLDACVAETGAIAFRKHEGGRVTVLHSEPDAARRADNDARRQRAAERALREVPGARLALDNMGRVYDTAFDLVEDGPPLDEGTASAIREIVEAEGLAWAQSSVHINAWVGQFDKATMVDQVLAEEGTTLDDAAARLCYVGDSANDGAMFRRTPLSVGVRNVAGHLKALEAAGSAPRYLVDKDGGHGFADIVKLLLEPR